MLNAPLNAYYAQCILSLYTQCILCSMHCSMHIMLNAYLICSMHIIIIHPMQQNVVFARKKIPAEPAVARWIEVAGEDRESCAFFSFVSDTDPIVVALGTGDREQVLKWDYSGCWKLKFVVELSSSLSVELDRSWTRNRRMFCGVCDAGSRCSSPSIQRPSW